MDQAGDPGVLPEDTQMTAGQAGVGGPTITRNKPAHQWPAGLVDVGATKRQVHAVQGPESAGAGDCHDDWAVGSEQPNGGRGGPHIRRRSGMEVNIHGGGMGGRCRSPTVGGTTDGMEPTGGGAAGCREGGQNGGIPRHEEAKLGHRQFGGSLGGFEQAIENTPQRQGHDGARNPTGAEMERHGAAAHICPLKVESSGLHFQDI